MTATLAAATTAHKILVLMSDNRQLNNTFSPTNYWSNVAYINKIYCDKFGYDFKYITPFYKVNTHHINSCIDVNTKELRHSSWSKIPVILNYIDKYDYIVYIDTDCIFRNFNISLEQKIEQYKDSSLIFQSNSPWHPHMPCAGFFICKNTIENINFLREWYTYKMPTYSSEEWQKTLMLAKKIQSYDWPPGNHWEQDALWCLIANNLYTATIDSTEIAFKEESGQFIRHIPSCDAHNRNRYFNSIIQELQKTFPDYTTILKSIHSEEFDTSTIF